MKGWMCVYVQYEIDETYLQYQKLTQSSPVSAAVESLPDLVRETTSVKVLTTNCTKKQKQLSIKSLR